jgi:hypothetical protein
METKRIALRVASRRARVLEQARAKLEAAVSPEYREILLGWIVEAAIGLGQPEAAVNASAPELPLLDQGLLAEAERRVQALGGRAVRLSRLEGEPLAGGGWCWWAAAGAWPTTTRSPRACCGADGIRKMICDGLWTKES